MTLILMKSIEEIVKLGLERSPHEACGLLLPSNEVVELKNLCETPTQGFEVRGWQIIKILEERGLLDIHDLQFMVWHTHPSGFIGPSKGDLENRLEGLRYLVVSLPNGEAVQY